MMLIIVNSQHETDERNAYGHVYYFVVDKVGVAHTV